MENKSVVEVDGFKIVQMKGGFLELYFEWSKLPELDLSEQYYCIRAVPDTPLVPVEYAKPNSEGPLFLYLVETVTYQIDLIKVFHLKYTVTSDLPELPYIDLIPQHENLQKLIWGHIDFSSITADHPESQLEIWDEDHLIGSQSLQSEPVFQLRGRPASISGKINDRELFQIQTNLSEVEVVRSTSITIEKLPTKLYFSTIISPSVHWRIRAELNPTFRMRLMWQRFFAKRYPKIDANKIIGSFRMIEDDRVVGTIRQFGFWTRVRSQFIEKIQLEEWNLKQRKQVTGIKLQLQISSAHRELFRFVLAEKEFGSTDELSLVGFNEEEVEAAEIRLSQLNNRVSWDQAHLELVLWFQTEGKWHEFQRDNAQNLSWEFNPSSSDTTCRCEWILTNIEDVSQQIMVIKSGVESRPSWKPKLLLQPYSPVQLVAVWDLNQQQVEGQIRSHWNVSPNEIGFYLKVHEEYLGSRIHRADLDVHIPELFTTHQNLYFNVESDKCFSAEIVARHYHSEMALTPVSKGIVTPRAKSRGIGVSTYQAPARWYHSSQREVRHLNGKDRFNKSRVILHLHMHSPNLFRAEPFRESFLKDVVWPIKTAQGTEVHNPPGEWVVRNCMDSWLPLLRAFRKLAWEQIDFQISLDISPPVAYVLSSLRFKDYMSRYLLRMQEYIRGQLALIKNRSDSQHYIYATERYLQDVRALEIFYNHELNKDIIGAFCDLEKKGYLEISTCTATHGMPAELAQMPDLLQAQITLAARSHHRLFGDRPHGIWLAENSFFPGVESYLSREYLNYFFVESESVLQGSITPREEEFNPVILPGTAVAAFPRSRLGRTQVWDAELGYAGHPDFREYHFRHFGLSVKRITSKTSNNKEPYNPDAAEETAKRLAWDFYDKLSGKAHQLEHQGFKTIPLITCSYDAELFGHHWSEGPIFLEELIREFYRKGDAIGLTTPSHYLVDAHALPEVVPNPSTWGHDAVHVRWSDPKVIWTYRELARAEEILNQYLGLALEGKLETWQKTMVEQMAAELIRAQSSDLTFVIMSGDFEEDMQREILKYLNYFYRLRYLIDNEIQASEFLAFRQYENDMFPEINAFYNI